MKTYLCLIAITVILFFTTTVHAQDFYIHENGVTIVCDAAEVGDTWEYLSTTYTKRSKDQITVDNASTTCTSGITSMTFLFSQQSGFNQNISHWDVSKVTSMQGMFERATSFNQDISAWDVSSVTIMSYMFQLTSFNQDINNWDVSSVTTMRSMFRDASDFNQELNNWDVRNVRYMNAMFQDAESFNQDLSSWCIINITSEPGYFNLGGIISSNNKPIWGTCPAAPKKITLAYPLNQSDSVDLDENLKWNSDSKATSYQLQVFNTNGSTILDTTTTDTTFNLASTVLPETEYLWKVKGLADIEIDLWSDMWSFTTAPPKFYLKDNGVTIICSDAEIGESGIINGTTYTKRSKDQITTENASTTCTSDITDMSGLFEGASTFNGDISHWDVSSVTNIARIFSGALNFNQNIEIWDVSNVIYMTSSFEDAKSFNSPLNNWNVSSVTYFSNLFKNAISFNQPLNNWDISNSVGEGLINMFNGASTFNQSINEWDLSSITSLFRFFYNATSFDQPLNNWNVSSVTDFRESFYSASSFNKDLSDWDVRSGQRFHDMFREASLFNQDLSTWKLFSATNMERMFRNTSLSIINYSKILIYWSKNDSTAPLINFNDLPSYNQDAIEARQKLIDDFNWTITDGGLVYYPDSLELISPAQNEIGVSTSPKFKWKCLAGGEQNCSSSHIQISIDSTFNSTVFDSSAYFDYDLAEENLDLLNNYLELETPLDFHTTYYWRVRGSNTSGVGEWSEVWSFTTVDVPLSSPSLSTPFNEQVNVGTLTEFTWNEVESSVSYHLQVSTDDQFSSTVFDSSKVGFASFTLTEPLSENTTYFWRMKSISDNELRNSEWSDTLTFTTGVRTSIEDELIPQEYLLSQNYPNPFNPSTQIQYALPEATEVTLEVFNNVGQKVMELVNGQQSAGYHTATFDASGLSSGVYLYKLTTPSFTETKKMLLIK